MGRQRKSKIKKVFKQRKDGILKKAFELSTLCEVDVGVIIFGPEDASPSIWPKEPEVLHNIVTRYQKTSNEERRKRATNMYTSRFRNIGSNGNDKKEDNLVTAEVPMYNIDNFSAKELMGLYSSIEEKIEAVNASLLELV
ncbi:agamous-like MADS-box protein AGL82 [Chenopodium quinoa]|uniref:MADS-box domain-containing protein n=1 Tax=Chenopodium quinoa TaxID=63459 RepID=A0A803LGI7_CHEQI|nr:agamous-like MADS-box protein AGL82 [Chenopodium quinoa]